MGPQGSPEAPGGGGINFGHFWKKSFSDPDPTPPTPLPERTLAACLMQVGRLEMDCCYSGGGRGVDSAGLLQSDVSRACS